MLDWVFILVALLRILDERYRTRLYEWQSNCYFSFCFVFYTKGHAVTVILSGRFRLIRAIMLSLGYAYVDLPVKRGKLLKLNGCKVLAHQNDSWKRLVPLHSKMSYRLANHYAHNDTECAAVNGSSTVLDQNR